MASQEGELARHVRRCVKSPYVPSTGTHYPEHSNDRVDVYLLTTGTNTWIWRVVPRDAESSPYIYKEYKYESKYLKEKAAFDLVKELFDGSTDSFRLVEHRDLGIRRKALQLSEPGGRSLYRVLKDERIPEDIKESLRNEYDRRYEAFKAMVRAKYRMVPKGEGEFFGTGRPCLLYEIGDVTLTLSPDQVVVRFNPEDPKQFTLFLVDPY